MSTYTGPRLNELAIVQGPLVKVVELAARGGVAGAVVTADGLSAWLPLAWLVRVALNTENDGHNRRDTGAQR